jgi:hypothetical protein
MVKKPNAKKKTLNVGWTLGSTTYTKKEEEYQYNDIR